MPAIDLAGKPIAITGASSGIGAATAIACATAGMPVAIGARRADKVAEVVGRITRAGGRAVGVVTDVTVEGDNQRLIDECVRAFGSIYAVYANAGYGEERPIAEMPDADIRAMFETNFFGTLSTVRAALPRLLANPAGPGGVRGHALICSSCLAKVWVPYYAVYSATKAAQNHVGRALNLELWDKGVRVSTVHPIGTRTEFFDVVRQRAEKGKVISLHTPDAMMQSPELVAARTVACLRRPRPEVWTGVGAVLLRTGMCVANMLPGLTDRAMRRMLRGTGALGG